MCSLPGFGWVALLASSLLLIGGDSQLTVEPGRILTGGKVCPDTAVRFTCVAINVRVLTWLRNVSEQIAQFTNQDMASTEPEMNGPFSIYLNSSDNDGQNNLNVTSTLVGPASGFQSGDRIACPDNNGDPLVLDFTTTTTPVPDGFQVSVSNTDNTLYLDIRWDSVFNVMYGIESYQIEASNGFISCPEMCFLNDSSPCRCSGLTAGMDGNITITATTCGNQQGPPAVVYLTPRVPGQVSSCSSYPVYNASNRLYRIETTWNQVVNPCELTSAVGQNILDYSVSFDEEATLTNCSSTSSTCSLTLQPVTSLSTVSVAARNVIGQGQERICNLSSSANSQTNNVFTITLSTTNLNRSVACRGLMPEQPGLFSCQFCIEINAAFTCYNLENSASNSAANAALTDLGEGTYLYRVTAFLDGIPVASISDFFSTACQLGELGATDGQTNSSCLLILNGRVCYNGTTAGSVATYSCNDGFTLTGLGSSQRTCRSDGLWEGDIPSCDATDNVPGWVIPLLAISVFLWVISLVEGVVSIPLVIVLERKFSNNENKFVKAFSYSLLVLEIILLLLIFILWMVYASDPKGVLGRNCVTAAFAFSLVLVVVGLIDSIPVMFYLKSAAESLFNARNEPQEEECAEEELKVKPKTDDYDSDEEDPEKQQRHKDVRQK